jgi:hypothetical protein
VREALPLCAARIEDLGPGDFVKVDRAARSHTALLTPTFLDGLGLLQRCVRCRGCGARRQAVVSIKWRKTAA